MNKQEQSDLCALLAKLRYDMMELIVEKEGKDTSKENEIINAVNKILNVTMIDGTYKLK